MVPSAFVRNDATEATQFEEVAAAYHSHDDCAPSRLKPAPRMARSSGIIHGPFRRCETVGVRPGFQNCILRDGDWLAAEYRAKSMAEIAATIGVSSSSVLRALRSHGIERRSRHERRPPIQHSLLADRDWLVEQYSTSTATAIATLIGVNLDTVRRALRIHGITPHTATASRQLTRPHQLNDASWLRRNYATGSIASMAHELGVSVAAVHTAMVRLGVERRARGEAQARRRPALLDDPEQLAEVLSTMHIAEIATDLGVAVPTVHVALKRNGVQSPWRYDAGPGLDVPPDSEIVRAWEVEETIRGVARQFEVSVTTAAVWLARVGIFLSEVPRISKSDLVQSIQKGESIDAIRRHHHVTARTVVIELHRHSLFDAHRRRHMKPGELTRRSEGDGDVT